MTTVVLSPPSRPSSPPASASAAKPSSVLVSVGVTPSNESAMSGAADGKDSAKDCAALGPEPDEADAENVARRANHGDAPRAEEEEARDAEPAARLAPLRTAESTTETTRSNKKRPRVAFEEAEIVEFEPTIFTTTVTSGGIPLGMSLNERSRSRRRLDSFELERQTLRVGRQSYMEEGYLDPQEREFILNQAGCEEPTMVSVEAEVNAIIQHRRESNEMDFDFVYGLGDIEEDDAEAEVDSEEEEDDAEDAEEATGDAMHAEETQQEAEDAASEPEEELALAMSEDEAPDEQLAASPPPVERSDDGVSTATTT